MHRARLSTVLLTLVVLGAVGLGLSGFGSEGRAESNRDPYYHRAEVLPVKLQGSYALSREFAGEVRARQSSLLGFERGGQVESLLVNEGDQVAPGQLMARLDTRLLLTDRDRLDARRRELETQLDLARRNLDRVARLQDENLASERERDELTSRVGVLEASLQQVAADLESVEVQLEQSELRAPFAARVASREVDSGVVVATGSPVFRLVESAGLEVRAGLPLRLAASLATGDPLAVRVDGQISEGRVIAVGPLADQATRSRSVRVAVGPSWAPGSLAYLRVEERVTQPGAWLPDTAVTEGLRGTWVAYVAVPAGDGTFRLETRSVVIHHADGGRLFVSGALADGDLVVARGLHRLAPGQIVTVAGAPRVALLRTSGGAAAGSGPAAQPETTAGAGPEA